MKRDSFVLSSVVAEALSDMSDENFAPITKAIFHYCMTGEETENLAEEQRKVFRFIKTLNLDVELEKYDKYMERRIPAYNEWRKAVFNRDEFTCQCCGQIGGRLNAHHIKSFADNPELRFDVNNGVTLCYECHKSFHGRRKK